MSKAIIVKGIDASNSPLGQITFVTQEKDLTSQIKWEGLLGGSGTKARIFSQSKNEYGSLNYSNYGGSVGVLDVSSYQGATIEIKCYSVHNSGYFENLLASAISATATSLPMTDEGLSIIPVGSSRAVYSDKITAFSFPGVTTTATLLTGQVTVPTVDSGKVYMIFTNYSEETTFSGYVKVLAG